MQELFLALVDKLFYLFVFVIFRKQKQDLILNTFFDYQTYPNPIFGANLFVILVSNLVKILELAH